MQGMNEQIQDQGTGRSDGLMLGLAVALVVAGVVATTSGPAGWTRRLW